MLTMFAIFGWIWLLFQFPLIFLVLTAIGILFCIVPLYKWLTTPNQIPFSEWTAEEKEIYFKIVERK